MVVRGITKVTRKGQITIPAAIREAAGFDEGDRVEVCYDETTRQVTLQETRSVVERTAGIFPPKVPLPSDIYELVAEEKRRTQEGMQQAAIDRDRRSRHG